MYHRDWQRGLLGHRWKPEKLVQHLKQEQPRQPEPQTKLEGQLILEQRMSLEVQKLLDRTLGLKLEERLMLDLSLVLLEEERPQKCLTEQHLLKSSSRRSAGCSGRRWQRWVEPRRDRHSR